MTKREGLFVKINYNNNGGMNSSRVKDDRTVKNNNINATKYLLCGGVFNKNGNTMIFQARNMHEAEQIVHNNPFVKSQVYSYEILKGDVIAL